SNGYSLLSARFSESSLRALPSSSADRLESPDKSSGPNPTNAPDVLPTGTLAHCKSESLQKFRPHRANRDRTPRLLRLLRAKTFRQYRWSDLNSTHLQASRPKAGPLVFLWNQLVSVRLRPLHRPRKFL